MTGTFPGFHGVRDNGSFYLDESATTLAEVLQPRGYRTGGFVGAFVLDRRWGIAQGFGDYFDEFDLSKFEMAGGLDAAQRPGREVVDRALAWLEQDTTQPFFAWVHLYDPHAPYTPPEPYRSQFPATAQGAYDGEVAATDAQIGRLIASLEASGRLASTIVVVVGDHGEMLGEHGEQQHGFFVYDAAVRIPLIVAGPDVPAREVRDQVRIVDVMPTILELVGAEIPAAVQGASLLPFGTRRGAGPAGVQRDLVSALSLRLERAHRDPGRPLQVHRRAAARALRHSSRSRRAEGSFGREPADGRRARARAP